MNATRKETGLSKSELLANFNSHIGTAMGARFPIAERVFRTRSPVCLSLGWLLLYVLLAALVWTVIGWPLGTKKLASLTTWVGVHFAAQLMLARRATQIVCDIIERDILPFACQNFVRAADGKLKSYSEPMKQIVLPTLPAVIVVVASVWAVTTDTVTKVDNKSFWLLSFWALASLYTYAKFMRCVAGSVFPLAFARALEQEGVRLHPLSAAQTPIIQGLAKLNLAVLTYWIFVFAIICSLFVLVSLPGHYAIDSESRLLVIIIPVAGFISLGVGAYVYLTSEFLIGNTLRRHSLARASVLSLRMEHLLERAIEGDEAALAETERLAELHDRIIVGGRYGSRLGATVSVALPLALPAFQQASSMLHKASSAGHFAPSLSG